MMCDRCGIDVPVRGLCADCAEVTGGAAADASRIIPRRNGYDVRGTLPKTGVTARVADERMAQVARLTKAGLTTTEIALETGMSSRTVKRYRARARVVAPRKNPWDYYRDPDAARERARGQMLAMNGGGVR